jgi:hypothetical protein
MRNCNRQLTKACKQLVNKWLADAALEKRKCIASAPDFDKVAMSATTTARAETATSRALGACSKLSGPKYHACLDRIPKCEAVLVRDVDDYWHKGMEFDIDGGSDDPGQLCQHGGSCIPVSAVKFKTACMIVIQKNPRRPTILPLGTGEWGDDESALSVRECANRIMSATTHN